jgi:hypothetical protein
MCDGTNPRLTRITLAIERDSTPITGFVLAPAELSGPFRGWLELTTRIETIHLGDEGARGTDAIGAG